MAEADRVLEALFDASTHMDLRRLPERFCGVWRKRERAPTAYPVACSPQAWASAAPFGLLAAALGLEVDARAATVRFRHPRLPVFLDELWIDNLTGSDSSLDVLLHWKGDSVAGSVLRKAGQASVEVLM